MESNEKKPPYQNHALALQSFGISPFPEGETTLHDLREMLRRAEVHIPTTPCALVPTSFRHETERITAFPRHLRWEWPSLKSHFGRHSSNSVMMLLPLFWQMESSVYRACNEAHAVLFVADTANAPINAAAIASLSIDTVLTSVRDCEQLLQEMAEQNTRIPPHWIFVHDASEPLPAIPPRLKTAGITVTHEVHLFPGVPLLQQCEALSVSHSTGFHVTDVYEWEFHVDHTLITSIDNDPLPLIRFRLPFITLEKGVCQCGKLEYTRV